jgi:alpha-glucoside transport system permease protein
MSAKGYKSQKTASSILVNTILIVICLLWTVPTVGILITSFRQSEDIFRSGWWTVFPHKASVETGEILLDDSVDVNGPITLEGVTATFEEWRQGITLDDGRTLQWFGNKRTRKLTVSEQQWVGFSTNLTMQNYKDVIGGKTITFKDGAGNTITRQGNNLGQAFLNSLGVSIPGTIIPILMAAFAAFGFSWLNFPGKTFFSRLLWLCWLYLCNRLSSPFARFRANGLEWHLSGNLAGAYRFGLPLATYLLFNYISSLSRELLEAAYIDGASNFTVFTRMILPLSVPSLASFAIFQFLWLWNDYLVALIFLGEKNRVVTFALASLVGEKGQDWHLMTSGAFVSMILPLLVFLLLQRYFVRGLMAGSVKG